MSSAILSSPPCHKIPARRNGSEQRRLEPSRSAASDCLEEATSRDRCGRPRARSPAPFPDPTDRHSAGSGTTGVRGLGGRMPGCLLECAIILYEQVHLSRVHPQPVFAGTDVKLRSLKRGNLDQVLLTIRALHMGCRYCVEL